MNLIFHALPMLALFIAQLAEAESKLTVYGPMGIICLWLMYRDESSRREVAREKAEIRQDNASLRGEIRDVAHQMKGLNRNLLYVTATHGHEPLRSVAQRELDRISATE